MRKSAFAFVVALAGVSAPLQLHAARVQAQLTGTVTSTVGGSDSADISYDTSRDPVFIYQPDPHGVMTATMGPVGGPYEVVGNISAPSTPSYVDPTKSVGLSGGVGVSLSHGTIQASIDGASRGYGGGYAHGEMEDTVTFHNASNAERNISINYFVHGSIGEKIDNSWNLSVETRFQFMQTAGPTAPDNRSSGNQFHYQYAADYNNQTPSASFDSVPNYSPALTSVLGTNATGTITITLEPGDSTYSFKEVTGMQGGGVDIDYSHTTGVTFDLPSDVTFTSGGLFVAVPEPASISLLAPALLLLVRRRRSR